MGTEDDRNHPIKGPVVIRSQVWFPAGKQAGSIKNENNIE
jgi:hypothetical protein